MIVLLSIIYPLRKVCRKNRLPPNHILRKANNQLRKFHKELGVCVIFLIIAHCKISSQKLGVNLGTFCLTITIFLFVSYLLRKRFRKTWLKIHRQLTVVLWVGIILHTVIDTERIRDFLINLF